MLPELVFASVLAAPVWADWERFKQLYLSADGRVIDRSTESQITTSEGQSYALTFALIANDPVAFAKLFEWTRDNLSQGDLAQHLPAWQWGKSEDGSWRVLDANAASDSDLWIAYTLGEAGRLWCNPSYASLGRELAARILREEVALVPELGLTLLPGPKGFVNQNTWRLNASYVPLMVLRGVERQTGDKLWRKVTESAQQMIVGSAPKGFAADWIRYRPGDGFLLDAETGGIGSYNAIRVYLWAGMLPAADSARKLLERRLAPMVQLAIQNPHVVEKVNVDSLQKEGTGPYGFSAALLPMLLNARAQAALQAHRARVERGFLQASQNYYSDVLAMFGLGWIDGRFRFDRNGRLEVKWPVSCQRAR